LLYFTASLLKIMILMDAYRQVLKLFWNLFLHENIVVDVLV
jgi:hypothetical protein